MREHFSYKHVLRIHLLYDGKNAVGTLENSYYYNSLVLK